MAFISEYHSREIHFLALPHPFQPFRLVPLVKRWPCLRFLDGSYFLNSLKQIAKDNFGILKTLKICLVKASWVFITW